VYRVVAFIVVALASRSAASDCKSAGLVTRVLTPTGAVVPGDGGIIVAAVNDWNAPLPKGDVAVQATWRLRIGSDVVKPPIEVIAPGLAIYRVAVANAFKAELVNDKQEVVASVRPARGGDRPLPAPQVTRAFYERVGTKHGGERVGIEIGTAVPANAVALVIADANGTPRSWTALDVPGLFPYRSMDCQSLPNGTLPTKTGDKIMTFWLDAGGRKSAPSKPIIVE
jgi:hypothetical protein